MQNAEANHEIVTPGTYFAVFAVLIVLTAATVWVATIDLGDMNVVVALVVATIKAVLVLLFFMHLRHSGALLWIALAFALGFMTLLIGLTLSDVLTRGLWSPLGPNVEGFHLSPPAQSGAP